MNEQPERDHELDARLSIAYRVAITAQHQSCRVQMHVGPEMVAYLKTLANIPDTTFLGAGPTMFGFPVVPDDTIDPRGISVHSVQRIA